MVRCHGSGKETGPLAASPTVLCLWCGQELDRVTPPPGEAERLPVHNLPALQMKDGVEDGTR